MYASFKLKNKKSVSKALPVNYIPVNNKHVQILNVKSMFISTTNSRLNYAIIIIIKVSRILD